MGVGRKQDHLLMSQQTEEGKYYVGGFSENGYLFATTLHVFSYLRLNVNTLSSTQVHHSNLHYGHSHCSPLTRTLAHISGPVRTTGSCSQHVQLYLDGRTVTCTRDNEIVWILCWNNSPGPQGMCLIQTYVFVAICVSEYIYSLYKHTYVCTE